AIFDKQELGTALAADAAGTTLLREEVLSSSEDGKTTNAAKGALIPWIDGLSFWALEKEPLRTEVQTWLSRKTPILGGDVSRTDRAAQVSTMIVFDAMTSNWDRYSGGNVGLDKTGTLVLFIDNDAAFTQGPPKEALAKNMQLVEATDRFSKSFLTRVRSIAVDEDKVASALGEESPGKPLVSRTIVHGVVVRTKEILAIIDAKIAAHGEADTLPFP